MSKVNFATREEFISINKVTKQLIHAGSCVIKLWMHLGKFDRRGEDRLAPRVTLALLWCSGSQLPACVMTPWFSLRHESIVNRTCFTLQFDPVTSQDSTSTTTCTTQSSSCLTSNTSSNKTETTVTTVTAVTVSPTVALTTSGGITSNVAMETDQSKAPNDSAETSRLHETTKERSESSSTVAEQGRGKTSQTAARNNSSISDDTSKRDAGEDHVSAPAAPEPPVSPTGSLHSESGASATGVRETW